MRSLALIAACMAMLGACANDPVQVAKTPLQKAYAVMLDYETVQQLGLTFVENPATPQIAKDALILVEQASTPMVKDLSRMARQVEAVRKAVLDGTATPEALMLETAKLAEQTAKVRAQVTAFDKAIAEARVALRSTVWEPEAVPIEPLEVIPPIPYIDETTLRRVGLQEI